MILLQSIQGEVALNHSLSYHYHDLSLSLKKTKLVLISEGKMLAPLCYRHPPPPSMAQENYMREKDFKKPPQTLLPQSD